MLYKIKYFIISTMNYRSLLLQPKKPVNFPYINSRGRTNLVALQGN